MSRWSWLFLYGFLVVVVSWWGLSVPLPRAEAPSPPAWSVIEVVRTVQAEMTHDPTWSLDWLARNPLQTQRRGETAEL